MPPLKKQASPATRTEIINDLISDINPLLKAGNPQAKLVAEAMSEIESVAELVRLQEQISTMYAAEKV